MSLTIVSLTTVFAGLRNSKWEMPGPTNALDFLPKYLLKAKQCPFSRTLLRNYFVTTC